MGILIAQAPSFALSYQVLFAKIFAFYSASRDFDFGGLFFGVSGIPGNFLIAINRQRLVIATQITAILLALLFDFWQCMRDGAFPCCLVYSLCLCVYGGGYMF